MARMMDEMERRLYGPKGFTQRPEVWEILLPYLTDERYIGGIIPFEMLPAHDLVLLADLLPPGNLDDRQNASPTFAEFVEFAKMFPDLLFHGYIVSPERIDERITITGFYAPPDTAKKILTLLLAENRPDEVCAVSDPKYGDLIWVWWD